MRRRWLAVPASVMLVLVALVAANAIDEELSPQARELFTRPAVAFEPASAWALIEGFHAPPGEDARAFAAALRQASVRREPGRRKAAPVTALEVRAPDELLC